MAYSELDRVYIRKYIGYGAIFLQAEPRLENAILATQSQAEGGGRPDSNTENYIKGLIYGSVAVTGTPVTPGGAAQNTAFAMPAQVGLLAIEQQLAILLPIAFVTGKADDATIDPYRAMMHLRSEGRRLATQMARMLGMKGVRADVFSPGQPVIDDDPFMYSDLHHWRRGP